MNYVDGRGSRGSKDSSISDHVTPSLAYSLLHNAEKYYLTEIPDTYFLQDICSLRNKNNEITFIVKLYIDIKVVQKIVIFPVADLGIDLDI